ncbi:hypothetical protein CDAR_165321 [Caerostris darwini]|uniref:Uncharacterized protein n=1 Tax=Caerostris darwini TaxID=1538125 RepID=A0AAV4NVH6_9ARAC|nr:hypothetical protein CDAR_165321 [Caerostris darwini]
MTQHHLPPGRRPPISNKQMPPLHGSRWSSAEISRSWAFSLPCDPNADELSVVHHAVIGSFRRSLAPEGNGDLLKGVLLESQFTRSGVISNYDISHIAKHQSYRVYLYSAPTPKGISRKLIFNRASHASLLHPRYKYSERHKTKGVHKFPEVACNRTTPIRQGGGQTAAVAPAEKRNAKRKEKQKVSEMKVSMEAADTPLTRNEPGITTEADVTATDHSLSRCSNYDEPAPNSVFRRETAPFCQTFCSSECQAFGGWTQCTDTERGVVETELRSFLIHP